MKQSNQNEPSELASTTVANPTTTAELDLFASIVESLQAELTTRAITTTTELWCQQWSIPDVYEAFASWEVARTDSPETLDFIQASFELYNDIVLTPTMADCLRRACVLFYGLVAVSDDEWLD